MTSSRLPLKLSFAYTAPYPKFGCLDRDAQPEVPRETGAACAPRGHAYNPAHAGLNRRAVRGRPRTRHPHGDGWEGQPSGPHGTRSEYGPRGISHPRNGRVPAGAPPTIRCAAGVPGGRWGSVVYGWRAPRPPRVVFVIGFASLL
eukprot:scaffold93016_cov66-Phaeocystis_antarctica.AAC.1